MHDINNQVRYSVRPIKTVDPVHRLPKPLLSDAEETPTRLAAYGLLNKLLNDSKIGSIDELKKDKLGRPLFSNRPDLWVSVAHSNEVVAAAFSIAGPIGIDVEQISCWNRGMEDIAFVAGEKFLLEKSPHRSREATKLWVRKEALGKAIGVGVEDFVLANSVIKSPVEVQNKFYYIENLKAPTGYFAAMSISVI